MSREHARDWDRFAGSLLMAVGGLVAALTGLCTLVVGGPIVAGALRSGDASTLVMLLLPLIVGGLPCWGGVAIAMIGWRQLRSAR